VNDACPMRIQVERRELYDEVIDELALKNIR